MNEKNKTIGNIIYFILLSAFCIFGLKAISQEKTIVSIGIDPSLLLSGAYNYDNTPVYDVLFSITSTKEKDEIGLKVEYANLKPYFYEYGFLYNYKLLSNYKSTALIGAEITSIVRGNRQFYSYGFNAEYRYWFNNFGVSLRGNLKRRSDLIKMYNSKKKFVYSNFLSLNYRI